MRSQPDEVFVVMMPNTLLYSVGSLHDDAQLRLHTQDGGGTFVSSVGVEGNTAYSIREACCLESVDLIGVCLVEPGGEQFPTWHVCEDVEFLYVEKFTSS